MKKSVSLCCIFGILIGLITGCGAGKTSVSQETVAEDIVLSEAETITAENTAVISETIAAGSTGTLRTGGKIVIDFEGTIISVEDDRVTLDSGQIIKFDENTVFSNADGVLENAELEVGLFIQGSTDDDPSAAEITARKVHLVVF